MPKAKTLLELRQLGDDMILHDVSLSVKRGEIAALMGRNGAGKSTLLKAIMGLHNITNGDISFMGEALQTLPPEARAHLGIGYVPQGKRLFADMTVGENIAVGLQARYPYERADDAAICDFLWQLFPRLKDRQRQIAGTLSGGEQQMLAMARALALRPKLLLLDEPSDGLQPSMVRVVSDCLQKLKAQKTAILLVEQNADWVFRIADNLTFIKAGHTSKTLTAKGDFKKPKTLNHYLGL